MTSFKRFIPKQTVPPSPTLTQSDSVWTVHSKHLSPPYGNQSFLIPTFHLNSDFTLRETTFWKFIRLPISRTTLLKQYCVCLYLFSCTVHGECNLWRKNLKSNLSWKNERARQFWIFGRVWYGKLFHTLIKDQTLFLS